MDFPAYIIEYMKKIEKEKADYSRPQIELPLPAQLPHMSPPAENRKESTRGVVIIDIATGETLEN